jgi:hypothetical protein
MVREGFMMHGIHLLTSNNRHTHTHKNAHIRTNTYTHIHTHAHTLTLGTNWEMVVADGGEKILTVAIPAECM